MDPTSFRRGVDGGSFYGSHGTFLGEINSDGRADLVGLGDGYIGALLATP